MIIPKNGLAQPWKSVSGSSDSPETGGWSSIIGIVTAIIGNVLISFALNTQRYAHVRLAREVDAQGPASNGKPTNGAHSRLVDRQTESGSRSNQDLDTADARETDPLLSKPDDDSETGSSASYDSNGSESDRKKKNYLKSPFWWLGIFLMVIGEAGNFLAYGFAPASIVSPLGVVALISNCLIAPIMLKELFRKRDLLGVVIAVGGAVTVVLSAKGSNPKLGPGDVWKLISQWEFVAYFGVTTAAIIVLMVASNRYGEKTIVIDVGLVALFGGYTALSTKGVASLLSYRLWRVFTFPITYLLVGVLAATAILQIKYVNRALQRFNSTQVIPTQFVFFTISVVVGSAILYRDFENATINTVAQFIGGVALTFLGVWCITGGRDDSSTQRHEKRDEEHLGIDLVDEEAEEDAREVAQVAAAGKIKDGPMPSTPQTMAKTEPTTPTRLLDSPVVYATASSRLGTVSPSGTRRPGAQPSLSSPAVPMTLPEHSAALSADGVSPISVQPSSRRRAKSSTVKRTTASGVTRVGSLEAADELYPAASGSPTSLPRNLLSRQSIAAGILPGPYMSPLSSGLSVIVADSRRRVLRGTRVLPGDVLIATEGTLDATGAAPSGGVLVRQTSLPDAATLAEAGLAPDGPVGPGSRQI